VLAGWFYVIGFWLGPHVIIFRHLRGETTADLAPTIDQYCVPVVRQIKIYQRDNGHLPRSEFDLGKDFCDKHSKGTGMATIYGQLAYWRVGPGNQQLVYDFTPGHEGWHVYGVFMSGPITLPPVTLEATTKPGSGH
jgi:hypothetical protein